MTQLPFTRILLSVTLASTLGLAGCDVETEGDATHTSATTQDCDILDTVTGNCAPITDDPDYFVPGTHPRWNPAAADIPLNTDILFADSTDGTAYVEMIDDPNDPNDNGDPTNPVKGAINGLDGWSTTAAFDIPFSGQIDPSTVNDGSNPMTAAYQNVFVLALNTVADGDALDPADIDIANPFDTAYAVPVMAQVVSLDGGANNVLRIAPTEPLDGPRKYIVIVTDGIEDDLDNDQSADGNPITASANYDLLGSTAPLADAALQPLRDAVGGWEALAVGYIQARNTQLNTLFSLTLPTDEVTLQASLALTYTFTTTDPVSPLLGMAAPRAALLGMGVPAASVVALAPLLSTPTARAVAISASADLDLDYLDGSVPNSGPLLANVGKLYTGAITLPSYQKVPASSADYTAFLDNWEADTVLGVQLSTPSQTLPPVDIDGATRNVTYRYPFAAKAADIKVPLQVTLPAAGCAMAGCPVTIYVHGITSDRASVAAVAYALAAQGVATVAVDLPTHGIAAWSAATASANAAVDLLNVEEQTATQIGTQTAIYGSTLQALYPGIVERHFNQKLDTNPGPTYGLPVPMSFASPTAADGSGSLFINLAVLANSRDNLKQGVMDLLNLNASLGNIEAALAASGIDSNGFDLSKVYLLGVSLGGIVGGTYTATNQWAYAADLQAYQATGANANFAPILTPIKGFAGSATGGQASRILENSVAFSGVTLPALAGAGAAQGTLNFEKYMYTTQSTIDSADVVNFIAMLRDSTINLTAVMGPDLRVPVLLQEIVGGGVTGGDGTYPYDLVVPNNAYASDWNPSRALGSAIPSPLTGTDPLAALLGIGSTAVADGSVNVASSGAALSQLSIGYHTSLLTTASGACGVPFACPSSGNALANGELLTQVVSFVLSGGASTAFGTAGTNAAAPFTTTYTIP